MELCTISTFFLSILQTFTLSRLKAGAGRHFFSAKLVFLQNGSVHSIFFFESLISLTYNRLNKAIWSFIPFRLKAFYISKVIWSTSRHAPVPPLSCHQSNTISSLHETFVMVIWKVKFHPYSTEYFVFISIEQF